MVTLSNWKLQSFDDGQVPDLVVAHPDYIDHFWMSAKVPGDVPLDLIAGETKVVEIGHLDGDVDFSTIRVSAINAPAADLIVWPLLTT